MAGCVYVPSTHEFIDGDTAVSGFKDDMFARLGSPSGFHCGLRLDRRGNEISLRGKFLQAVDHPQSAN